MLVQDAHQCTPIPRATAHPSPSVIQAVGLILGPVDLVPLIGVQVAVVGECGVMPVRACPLSHCPKHSHLTLQGPMHAPCLSCNLALQLPENGLGRWATCLMLRQSHKQVCSKAGDEKEKRCPNMTCHPCRACMLIQDAHQRAPIRMHQGEGLLVES